MCLTCDQQAGQSNIAMNVGITQNYKLTLKTWHFVLLDGYLLLECQEMEHVWNLTTMGKLRVEDANLKWWLSKPAGAGRIAVRCHRLGSIKEKGRERYGH